MNIDKTLLSIIYPFLNASSDIEAAFGYIKDQVGINKSQIEIIIINDGSTDDTINTIENFKHLLSEYQDVRVFSHEKRQGLSLTRLDGAKRAKGRYITFIDKKVRPDNNYIHELLNKNRNIVIGNPYINKERSVWGRVLAIVRRKIYYPYFNNYFDDINLDFDGYKKFKNKGGGGCMLVLKSYYLDIAKNMPTSIHANDDSHFIQSLTKIEPILKTYTARMEYINRTGFIENILHLFNRGPKFIDFYMKPGSRFFPYIIGLLSILLLSIVMSFINQFYIIYEIGVLLVMNVIVSLYISEDIVDFFVSIILLPVALISFSIGVLYGLTLKAFNRY